MSDQINASATPARVQGDVTLLSSSATSKADAIEILTSSEIMADVFRTRLSRIFPQGSILVGCKPKLLKGRQHNRQVLSYQLAFSNPSMRKPTLIKLVAKRFAEQKKGNQEYLVMSMLWEKGFNQESNLSIPRPFSFLEDLNLLIQESAQGTLLNKSLSNQSPVAIDGLKAAAQWLIKLHHMDADLGRIDPYPDDETRITGCVQRIGNRDPRLLPKLKKLSSAIEARLSLFRRVRFTPAHGDFQCENIFFDGEKVTVIDFGRFCKSDPARDLGCMIAQARATGFLKTASFTSLSTGLKAFWEEYLTETSFEEKETLSVRTCMFAAIKYLENIDYISSFSPVKGKDVWHSLLNDAGHCGEANRLEEIL